MYEKSIPLFIKELETNSPPHWDPNWEITKTLIEVVRIQAQWIKTLEENQGIIMGSLDSSIMSQYAMVAEGAKTVVATGAPNAEEINEAVTALNKAIELASKAEDYVEYMKNVLHFVSKVLV